MHKKPKASIVSIEPLSLTKSLVKSYIGINAELKTKAQNDFEKRFLQAN